MVSIDAAGKRVDVADNVVPAISDTGGVVAYDAIDAPVAVVAGNEPNTAGALMANRRVVVRDRVGGTSRPVAESQSAAPGISGNGCVVAYSVFGAGDQGPDVTLTVVDRCANRIGDPLPIGAPLGTVKAQIHHGRKLARPLLRGDR